MGIRQRKRPETTNANKVIITAIYYETSSVENLVGGQPYYRCPTATHTLNEDDGDWTCDNPTTDAVEVRPASTQNDPDDVVYTEDEIDDNDALVVRAKSDGDEQSVNLYLSETGRFDGRYVGMLRLTDSNGDGSADEDDTTTTNIDESERQDWGLDVNDGAKPPIM